MKSQNTASLRIKTIAKALQNDILHFFFPAFCLHCREEKVVSSHLFCKNCQQLVERFPIEECLPNKALALEREGLGNSLFLASKKGGSEEIVATKAAFMLLQFMDLAWPTPDVLIPSPNDLQALALSKKLSQLMKIPYCDALASATTWKKKAIFSDQTILVIADRFPFSVSFDVLEEAAPLKIFYLGLC